MSYIFLSHIEKDLPIMQEISQGLEAAGYRLVFSFNEEEKTS